MGQYYPQMSLYAFSEWLRSNGMHDTLNLLNHMCKDAPNWAFRDLNKMKQWAAHNQEKSRVLDDIVQAYIFIQNGLAGPQARREND